MHYVYRHFWVSKKENMTDFRQIMTVTNCDSSPFWGLKHICIELFQWLIPDNLNP